jgi:hypothetical protein
LRKGERSKLEDINTVDEPNKDPAVITEGTKCLRNEKKKRTR